MRRLILALLLLLPLCLSAQEIHRLTGYIESPGEPLISYFVQFTVNGTDVTGYTITNYKDGSRLRASLIGKLSPASELYIQENGSLDGAGSPFQSYCYFKAKLKLSITGGRQRWSGIFESTQQNGAPCGGGTMSLIDEAPPPDLPKPKPTPKPVAIPVTRRVPKDTVKPQPKDTVALLPKKELPKPVVIIAPPRPVPVPQPPPDPSGCMRTYEWRADSLVFDIWDGWTIDGDVVSLAVNDRLLLDHVKLSEIKSSFVVGLTKGLNKIVITLHDQGFDPPNTPNMIIRDGAEKHELAISGDPGEVVRICLNKLR